MPDDHEKARCDWRIPDEWWERIVPLLPPRKPPPLGCHRPRVDDRQAMEAIFCVLRTGCQWGALDATGLCSHRAAHRRCQAWTAADVCVALGEQGLVAYDALPGIAWAWLAMDGAMTQAPRGGEQGGPAPHGPRPERDPAQRPHRRPWGADRPGSRRRQSPGLHADARDHRAHRGRVTRSDRRRSARNVPGQRR
jgi:hypothetical protein